MQEKRLESWDLAMEDVSTHYIIDELGLVTAVPFFPYKVLWDFMQCLKSDPQPSWLIAHETVRQLHIMKSKRPHLRKLRKCQLRRIKRNEAKRHGR